MSYRTNETATTEQAAQAMLKAVIVITQDAGGDFTRIFERVGGHAMVRGHAWRAIKMALGNQSPVLFARKAGKAAVVAMLRKAIVFAAQARCDHPGLIEQGENADKWIVAQRLGGWQRKVDKAITKDLRVK